MQIDDSIRKCAAFLGVPVHGRGEGRLDRSAGLGEGDPSLGAAIRHEYPAAECRKAQATPGYQNAFRRFNLSQWTEQTSRAIDMGDWDASAGDIPWPEMESALRSRRCAIGLDLSTTYAMESAHVG